MKNQSGQILIEILLAMGIFVVSVTTITWLVLDVYLADRVGREKMLATFLATEGQEVARSIRDNNWNDLIAGEHGLAMSGTNWIFQGTQEDVSGQLREGVRRIIVEDIDLDRKKVTSQISWKLTEARLQEVSLISYLTNWNEVGFSFDCYFDCQSNGYAKGKCLPKQACPDPDELGKLGDYGCAKHKLCCCSN